MATQWRTGFSGATGLDYAALPAVLKILGIPVKRHRDVFDSLRIMEDEALLVMAEK